MMSRGVESSSYVRIMSVNWRKAQEKAATAARWGVAMVKVRIRQVVSRTRWQLVTFYGKSGGESVGVVDLRGIRKDHGKPVVGLRRGAALQIILKSSGLLNASTNDQET